MAYEPKSSSSSAKFEISGRSGYTKLKPMAVVSNRMRYCLLYMPMTCCHMPDILVQRVAMVLSPNGINAVEGPTCTENAQQASNQNKHIHTSGHKPISRDVLVTHLCVTYPSKDHPPPFLRIKRQAHKRKHTRTVRIHTKQICCRDGDDVCSECRLTKIMLAWMTTCSRWVSP